MLSSRLQLAFSSKPYPLISNKLKKPCSGSLPCKSRSVLERRLVAKKRCCISIADFECTDYATAADRSAILQILDMYQTVKDAPLWLTKKNVIDLIPYKFAGRQEFLKYLCLQENRRMAKKYESYHYERHIRKKIPNLGSIFDESGQLLYGMYNNTIVSVAEARRNRSRLGNLMPACLFGQRLVIDFAYDHRMRSKEQHSLAQQVALIHAFNCRSKEPFDLVLTGYSHNRHFEEFFTNHAQALPADLMITTCAEPLEKVFPVEDVIYLSPHSPNVMREFDHDAVYVLGALVDTYKTDREETSFLRATRSGIRTLRLPVLATERDNKPPLLTLNSVAAMLVDMKNEEISVEEAIQRHVSSRKMRPTRIMQQRERKQKYSHSDSTEEVERSLLIS